MIERSLVLLDAFIRERVGQKRDQIVDLRIGQVQLANLESMLRELCSRKSPPRL